MLRQVSRAGGGSTSRGVLFPSWLASRFARIGGAAGRAGFSTHPIEGVGLRMIGGYLNLTMVMPSDSLRQKRTVASSLRAARLPRFR